MNNQQRLELLKTFDKSKDIKRRILHFNGSYEDDAQHSYLTALYVMVFDDLLPKELDRYKTIQMLLIHDLVEIISGDVWFLASTEEREQKKINEMNAAKELFKDKPDFMSLFIEYEQKETLEAITAKQLDILQAVCTIVAHGGVTWKANKITREREMAFSAWIHQNGTPLGDFLASVFEYATKHDMFYIGEDI